MRRRAGSAISELPIRQVTVFGVPARLGRLSELPIRQVTVSRVLAALGVVSELPIRQVTGRLAG